jgi:hypothetical protein
MDRNVCKVVEIDETTIQTEEQMTSNLDWVIDQICANEPQQPKTFKLISEDSTEEIDVHGLGNDLAIKFMMRLFGADTNPTKLSNADFILLKRYLASVGFDISYKVIENETQYRYTINVSILP